MNPDGTASDVPVVAWEELWTTSVAYEMYNWVLESNTPEQQIVGNDSFGFVVYDIDKANSTIATKNITVETGVWASPVEPFFPCFEDTDCDVRFHGIAKADETVFMTATITLLPDTTYGRYIDIDDDGNEVVIEAEYELSTIDDYPFGEGNILVYIPRDQFFTIPDVMWNGTKLQGQPKNLTFRYFVSVYLTRDIVMSSEIVEQLVQVTNVNDRSNLSCPKRWQNMWVREDLNGAIVQSYENDTIAQPDENSTMLLPDEGVWTPFNLTERDRHLDAIRVDIEMSSGIVVSVGEEYKSVINYSRSCDDWVNVRCSGDGNVDVAPTFIGQPVDVANALNSMVYDSFSRFFVGNVTITVYDGTGGDCLGSFRSTSVRPSCETSSCSFQVDVNNSWFEGIVEKQEKRERRPVLVTIVYKPPVLRILLIIFMVVLILALVGWCKVQGPKAVINFVIALAWGGVSFLLRTLRHRRLRQQNEGRLQRIPIAKKKPAPRNLQREPAPPRPSKRFWSSLPGKHQQIAASREDQKQTVKQAVSSKKYAPKAARKAAPKPVPKSARKPPRKPAPSTSPTLGGNPAWGED